MENIQDWGKGRDYSCENSHCFCVRAAGCCLCGIRAGKITLMAYCKRYSPRKEGDSPIDNSLMLCNSVGGKLIKR